jgi:serine protease DegQ
MTDRKLKRTLVFTMPFAGMIVLVLLIAWFVPAAKTAHAQQSLYESSQTTPIRNTANASQSPIPGVPTLAPVIKPVMPAVVSVSVEGSVTQDLTGPLADPFFRRFFNIPDRSQERAFEHAGSGVIVDAVQGYVLTNSHVVDDADHISVTLSDDRQFDADLVGKDAETDLAVIKIPAEDLVAAPFGVSAELEVGDFVIAIGNPFGLSHTVTSGIVSAVGRSGLGIEGYEDFIQTDASINPGNSGGALLDLYGRLIGINTAIVGPSGGNVGIGFAIPSDMARSVMDQLVSHGRVVRGELGILVQNLTPEVARAMNVDASHGAVIAQVNRGSAAERAGLNAGDVIVAMDGAAIRDGADLRNRVGLQESGSPVQLDILRDGARLTKKVTLTSKAEGRLDGSTLDQRFAGVMFGPSTGNGVPPKKWTRS